MAKTEQPARERLEIGKFGGPHGVHGWIKVLSYTDPRENIFSYTPWQVNIDKQWQSVELIDGKAQGKGYIVRLAGIDSPEQAQSLTHCKIAVYADQLPALDEGEYYWRKLIGLDVFNRDGTCFGSVRGLIETGANDVLKVVGERERLLPYIDSVVLAVDVANGRIDVDWDADF